MKLVQLSSLALGALTVFSGVATAASGSLSEFTPKVLPVLVQVDAHGKVTGASPATVLTPKLDRLLRANLDEMINTPVIDKAGRPKSSQFIINLALQTSPRANGDYDMHFAYVSTSPVPSGSWYWVHIDGRRLALANRDSRDRSEPRIPYHYDQPSYRPIQDRGNTGIPAPAAAPSPAPAPVNVK